MEYGNFKNLEKDKLYIYFDEKTFSQDELGEVEDYLQNNNITRDSGAAIGAGASGLNPEIQVFINVTLGTLGVVSVGFLQKVGEDAWDKLKALMVKFARMKPDAKKLGYTEEFLKNHVINYDLLLHIHTAKQPYLVMLRLDDKDSVKEALEKLPEFIDDLVQKEDQQVHRLYWQDGSWGF